MNPERAGSCSAPDASGSVAFPADREFFDLPERNVFGDYTMCTKKEFAEVVRARREADARE
jgi:hypothetical protein